MPERVAVDPAVDELRRKARRRLVGAIVLALAAAVLLPMLLEKEPRPLGEDVAVRIPPVDDSKFVNRLSPGNDAANSKPAVPGPAAPGASTSANNGTSTGHTSAATPNAGAAQASPSTPPASPSGTTGDTAAGEAGAKAEGPKAEALKADAAGKSTPAGKPEALAKAEPSSASNATKDARPETKSTEASGKTANGFVVQLAAFSDDKGANALASKLKRNGYPAFTEPIQTSRGTLYRVRVGSYGSRDAAADARNKLKGDGYAGIVAPAH